MTQPERENNTCILTGKNITGNAVRTNLGLIHPDAYQQYKDLIAQSIDDVLNDNPLILRKNLCDGLIRRRAREIIAENRANSVDQPKVMSDSNGQE